MKTTLTTKAYVIGFSLSMVLTLSAYFTVVSNFLNGWVLVAALFSFAFAQLAVQLIFFLHLLQEAKPRWNLVIFIVTFSIILTVVIASLWIMNHLSYHLLQPQTILHDEGIKK